MPTELAISNPPRAPQRESSADRVDELMRIIGTYNAVTERLQRTHETLNREVNRLRDELASANAALMRSRRLAALGEMAAGIAHEVRNPLTCIQLYAAMLAKDLSDQAQPHEIVLKITEATRGLDAIVGDVLMFARESPPRMSRHCISRTIAEAIDAITPMLDSHEIRCVRDLGDRSLMVSHDRVLIGRAAGNLLRNGIEAMPGGGTLTVGVRPAGGRMEIEVRDTGPGIADAAIDRIFNPFFTTRQTGTGLGLAIVHRVVDAHGGSIAVHNDGGAVFTIELPVAGPDGRASRSDES